MRILKIFRDDNPDNPREWDNLGQMICWHRKYDLGDSHDFKDPEDFMAYVRKTGGIYMPLYLLDHSGLAISTVPFDDFWDSGQVGWIFCSQERAYREYNVKRLTPTVRKKVIEVLQAEVKVYNQYLQGEVYGFSVYALNGRCLILEDACGGFYGDSPKENGILEYIPAEFVPALKNMPYLNGNEVFLLTDKDPVACRNRIEVRERLKEIPDLKETLQNYDILRVLLS